MDPARLRSIRLFEPFSDDQLHSIAPFADETSVPEGEQLVREGDFSYQLIGIEEGTAEVRRGDERVAELGPGDFFGEMGLIDAERRNATVVAKTPLRLITLDQWDMRRLEKAIPSALARIREVIEQRRNA